MSDMDIDFNVEIDLTSDQEDELLNDLSDDDVDIYEDLSLVLLANDQHDVLEYEELSDLSGDEFLEEPAGSASEVPAAPAEEDGSPQELEFSEEDLLDADLGEPVPSTRPSSPAAVTATPPSSPTSTTTTEDINMESTEDHSASSAAAEVPRGDEAAAVQGDEPTSSAAAEVPSQDEAAAVQGCDPAIMHVSQQQLDEIIAKLPFPPLKATIARWRSRTASPSMKEYIQRINRDMSADGPSKFFLPYNLRDKLIANKERRLAQGPRINRQLIIEEY